MFQITFSPATSVRCDYHSRSRGISGVFQCVNCNANGGKDDTQGSMYISLAGSRNSHDSNNHTNTKITAPGSCLTDQIVIGVISRATTIIDRFKINAVNTEATCALMVNGLTRVIQIIPFDEYGRAMITILTFLTAVPNHCEGGPGRACQT